MSPGMLPTSGAERRPSMGRRSFSSHAIIQLRRSIRQPERAAGARPLERSVRPPESPAVNSRRMWSCAGIAAL